MMFQKGTAAQALPMMLGCPWMTKVLVRIAVSESIFLIYCSSHPLPSNPTIICINQETAV